MPSGVYVRTEEHKRHISESMKGEKHPMYGKHWSEEHNHKVSESLKGEKNGMYGKSGEKSPRYGKQHAEEHKQKMRDSWLDCYSAPTDLKDRCYSIYYQSLKKGIITRPSICELCHSCGRIIGHHEDYNKPLDVLWLCDSCHKKVHHGSF